MSNKGTGLELFVAEIEQVYATHPVNIEINRKTYLDDGKQLAEFDVVVEGVIGTSKVKLLLECRNRPSEGPAPVAWIEQLTGRRSLHGFDRVTAISTTGFSGGAKELASRGGIELREVTAGSLESISDWFAMTEMTVRKLKSELLSASVGVGTLPEDMMTAARNSVTSNEFCHPTDGSTVKPNEALSRALSHARHVYNGLVPGERRKIRYVARYLPESRFFLRTTCGNIDIEEIVFEANVWIEDDRRQIELEVRRYENISAQELISTTASFPLEVGEHRLELMFHHTPEGGTIIRARKLKPALEAPQEGELRLDVHAPDLKANSDT